MTRRAGNTFLWFTLIVIYAFVMRWLFLAPTRAQENSIGVLGASAISSGDGNAAAFGLAGTGAASLLRDRVALVGLLGIERAEKKYVGDGHRLFGRIEGRYYWAGQPQHDTGKMLRFFVSGGANLTRQTTSQYSKQAVNGMLGGGFNFDQRIIGRYHYLLREHQTANEVSGHRLGLDAFLPFAPQSRWRYLFTMEFQRWGFNQSGRRLGAQSFVLGVGVGRRFR